MNYYAKYNAPKFLELNGKVDLNPFEVEYITLTHSILEPNGLKIKTPAGVVLHTGDWKVDPNPLIGDNINSKRLGVKVFEFYTCALDYRLVNCI